MLDAAGVARKTRKHENRCYNAKNGGFHTETRLVWFLVNQYFISNYQCLLFSPSQKC